jgi:hypothetical protein
VSPGFEAYLARLYADTEARQRFLADPHGEVERAGLTPSEAVALLSIDRTGLEMAALSFERKRQGKLAGRSWREWARRLFRGH